MYDSRLYKLHNYQYLDHPREQFIYYSVQYLKSIMSNPGFDFVNWVANVKPSLTKVETNINYINYHGYDRTFIGSNNDTINYTVDIYTELFETQQTKKIWHVYLNHNPSGTVSVNFTNGTKTYNVIVTEVSKYVSKIIFNEDVNLYTFELNSWYFELGMQPYYFHGVCNYSLSYQLGLSCYESTYTTFTLESTPVDGTYYLHNINGGVVHEVDLVNIDDSIYLCHFNDYKPVDPMKPMEWYITAVPSPNDTPKIYVTNIQINVTPEDNKFDHYTISSQQLISMVKLMYGNATDFNEVLGGFTPMEIIDYPDFNIDIENSTTKDEDRLNNLYNYVMLHGVKRDYYKGLRDKIAYELKDIDLINSTNWKQNKTYVNTSLFDSPPMFKYDNEFYSSLRSDYANILIFLYKKYDYNYNYYSQLFDNLDKYFTQGIIDSTVNMGYTKHINFLSDYYDYTAYLNTYNEDPLLKPNLSDCTLWNEYHIFQKNAMPFFNGGLNPSHITSYPNIRPVFWDEWVGNTYFQINHFELLENIILQRLNTATTAQWKTKVDTMVDNMGLDSTYSTDLKSFLSVTTLDLLTEFHGGDMFTILHWITQYLNNCLFINRGKKLVHPEISVSPQIYNSFKKFLFGYYNVGTSTIVKGYFNFTGQTLLFNNPELNFYQYSIIHMVKHLSNDSIIDKSKLEQLLINIDLNNNTGTVNYISQPAMAQVVDALINAK